MPLSFTDGKAWLRNGALAALVGYWLALFVGTHIPITPELLEVLDASDKTLHFSAYAGLAVLLAFYWWLRGALTRWQWVGIWTLTAGYGVLDEITQIPVGRTCDLYDWLADATGSLVGLGCFALLAALWQLYFAAPKSQPRKPADR